MWPTPDGDRVLEGLERESYLELVLFSIDELNKWSSSDPEMLPLTGDRIFDSARLEQKIVLLKDVTCALLDPYRPILKLTNVSEAAAYFPYAILQQMIEDELSDRQQPISYQWREFLWRLFEEYCEWDEEDEDDNPFEIDRHSNDSGFFEEIIENMKSRIFHDNDWMASSYSPQILDGVDPAIEMTMGYGDDYFTTKLPIANLIDATEAVKCIRSFK